MMTDATEDEAKTKWCPMSRTSMAIGPAGDVDYATNRLEGTGMDATCVGSACMMWRQLSPNYQENGNPWPHGPTGYCGLAGRPA